MPTTWLESVWRDREDIPTEQVLSWLNRRWWHLIIRTPSQNLAEEHAKIMKKNNEKGERGK